jgi:hypothetical protein
MYHLFLNELSKDLKFTIKNLNVIKIKCQSTHSHLAHTCEILLVKIVLGVKHDNIKNKLKCLMG